MLDREHGGMNEVLADLFEITGDRRYLDMAMRFSHRAFWIRLRMAIDKLDGLHANTQIPKIIGFSRIHEVGGGRADSDDRAAASSGTPSSAQRSFATGGHGDVEHFFPKHKFVEHLGSAKTMETCCTHNMMRLTRSLYRSDPQSAISTTSNAHCSTASSPRRIPRRA